MAIDNANFISELNTDIPLQIDPRTEGAGQIKAVKRALKQSFPNIDSEVLATSEQLNDLLKDAGNFPGMVTMWSGEDLEASYPPGWKKADGSSYTVGNLTIITPNLVGMFIKGVHPFIEGDDTVIPIIPDQPAEVVGKGGGENFPVIQSSIIVDDHTLTANEIPPHVHPFQRYNNGGAASRGSSSSQVSNPNTSTQNTQQNVTAGEGHSHTGNIEPVVVDNQPSYYVLVYLAYVGVGAVIQP